MFSLTPSDRFISISITYIWERALTDFIISYGVKCRGCLPYPEIVLSFFPKIGKVLKF